MIRTKRQELEAKRQDVRREYSENGISPEYEKLFEELHQLNMAFMAAVWAKSNGRSIVNPNNPYRKEGK
jgi:hypothetical protein